MLDPEAAAGAHLREAVGAVQHVPSTLLSSTFPRFRMLPWYRSLLAFATRLEVTCMQVGRWYHGLVALKPAGHKHNFSSVPSRRRQQEPIRTLARTMFAWRASSQGGNVDCAGA